MFHVIICINLSMHHSCWNIPKLQQLAPYTTIKMVYQNGSRSHSSGVTGGGQSAPQRLLTGKFLLMYREKRGKEKREKGWKLRRKEGKLWKGRWKIGIGSSKSYKKRWRFFFFLLFTFENDGYLFWVYQNRNLLPGKSISRRKKNQEKLLCSLRKICLLRPWATAIHSGQKRDMGPFFNILGHFR